jgi:F0F1-type ATP synthase assembly protein I
MLLIIGIGVWGGMKLDEVFHTAHPYFTIFVSLFAVVAAIVVVIRSVMNDQ